MDGEWVTYRQAAVRLGVSVEAARRRALRGNWRRMPDNRGRTLVMLPEPGPDDIPEHGAPDVSPDTSALVAALEGHVETLRAHDEQLQAQLSQRDEQLAKAEAGLAGANERAAAADARAVAAEARATVAEAKVDAAEAELAAERERSHGHRADYERERDRAQALVADMADRIAEAENLRGELAGANERAAAADVRSVTAEARAAAGEARADQLVADLNSLAARMAEVITQQMTPPPEPEPTRPWWQRWRRRA
jgi:hypothetical protein